MSKITLPIRIEDKSDEYLLELMDNMTLWGLWKLLQNVTGFPKDILHIHESSGTELIDFTKTLKELKIDGSSPLYVRIDVLKVYLAENRVVGYHVNIKTQTGLDLRLLVSKDLNIPIHRIDLRTKKGGPITDSELLDKQGVKYKNPVYVILRKQVLMIMEYRGIDRFTPKQNTPFFDMGKMSNAPGRVVGMAKNLDEALAMLTNKNAGVPQYDSVTDSYCLYSNGPIQYRAHDISAFVQQ